MGSAVAGKSPGARRGGRSPSPNSDFHCAADDEHQDEEGPDGGGRDSPGQEVGDPAGLDGSPAPGPVPAGWEQAKGGVKRHRRYGGTSPCGCTEDPQRRTGGEKERRKGQDDGQAREDETDPTDDRPEATPEAPGTVDRQLGRGRAREQIGGRDAVLELVGREPLPFVDAQLPEEGDVGRRAPEPDGSDASPLTDDGGERDVLMDGLGHARDNRMAGPFGDHASTPNIRASPVENTGDWGKDRETTDQSPRQPSPAGHQRARHDGRFPQEGASGPNGGSPVLRRLHSGNAH